MKAFVGKYWKVMAAMLGVFVAGMVVGGVLTVGVIAKRTRAALNPDNWQQMVMDRLDEKLNLTAEQRREIEPIVADGVEESRIILRESLISWGENIAHTRRGLEPILTPEQRTELVRLSVERREKFLRFLERVGSTP